MNKTAHRVLVADDERFFREAIVEALGLAGIACEAAASGAETLRAVSLDPRIGVAVLDLALERGLDLLRRLRRRPRSRDRASHPCDQNPSSSAAPGGRLPGEALHDEELVSGASAPGSL
jgi:CheY-like chemotaxis protein